MKNIGFCAMVALCLAACGEAVPQNLGSIRVTTPMYTAEGVDDIVSNVVAGISADKITDGTNTLRANLDYVYEKVLTNTWVVNGIPYTTTIGYTSCSYFPPNPNENDIGYTLTLNEGSSWEFGYYDLLIGAWYWRNQGTEEEPDYQWVADSGGMAGLLPANGTSFDIDGFVGTYPIKRMETSKLALTNDIQRLADLTDATNYTDSVAAEFENGTRTVSTANVADDAFRLYDSQGLVSYSATDLLLGATNAAEAALSSKRDLSNLNIYADPSANHTPITFTVWHTEAIYNVYTLQWNETYQSWRYDIGQPSFVVFRNGDGSYAINAVLEDYGGEVHTISRIITLSAPKWSATIFNVPGFNRFEIESIPTQLATDDFVNSRGFVIATNANIIGSLSQGVGNRADGLCAHAEGTNTVASERFAHSEGYKTVASGVAAKASGLYSISSGMATIALGANSHASNNFSFVWNAYDQGPAGSFYGSHGICSFNINPRNGLAGVWIGETNLQNHLNAEMSSKADASDLSYSLVTPGKWDFSGLPSGGGAEMSYEDGIWTILVSFDNETDSATTEGSESDLVVVFPDAGYSATRPSLRGHLVDRSSNLVKSSDTLQMTLPPPIHNKSRDFRVRLVITAPITSPNKITFVGATTNGVQEVISFESENGNFPSLNTISTNILHFTETAPSIFYVSSKIAIPTPAP